MVKIWPEKWGYIVVQVIEGKSTAVKIDLSMDEALELLNALSMLLAVQPVTVHAHE